VQVFRQELQRREYHVTRIVSHKHSFFTIPEEQVKVVVNQWEVVKRRVKVLEERICELPVQKSGEQQQESKLSQLLLWLHEAEALLGCYETSDGRGYAVPSKFLLRQHEVSTVISAGFL